jgi:hypothetical protein
VAAPWRGAAGSSHWVYSAFEEFLRVAHGLLVV